MTTIYKYIYIVTKLNIIHIYNIAINQHSKGEWVNILNANIVKKGKPVTESCRDTVDKGVKGVITDEGKSSTITSTVYWPAAAPPSYSSVHVSFNTRLQDIHIQIPKYVHIKYWKYILTS